MIDAVVPAEELPELVDRALGVLVDPPEPATLPRRDPVAPGTTRDHPVWDDIEATRGERAGVRELLRYGASGTLRLRGTDEGERDDSVLIALTRLDGQPCVLVGQDRARQSAEHPMGAGALREARRGMKLAEELGLPLVTIVDTPGAELSQRAEEGAIAGEIARCLAGLATLSVPTVSVILGQGCGGGALALLPARRVIAAERAWLMPLPPEGASVINIASVSGFSTVKCDVTLPCRSTSRRTSMRPSSAGSRRISNRLLPARALAAICTARPLTGTARLVTAVAVSCAAGMAVGVCGVVIVAPSWDRASGVGACGCDATVAA